MASETSCWWLEWGRDRVASSYPTYSWQCPHGSLLGASWYIFASVSSLIILGTTFGPPVISPSLRTTAASADYSGLWFFPSTTKSGGKSSRRGRPWFHWYNCKSSNCHSLPQCVICLVMSSQRSLTPTCGWQTRSGVSLVTPTIFPTLSSWSKAGQWRQISAQLLLSA